jgi:hypothetical protein
MAAGRQGIGPASAVITGLGVMLPGGTDLAEY